MIKLMIILVVLPSMVLLLAGCITLPPIPLLVLG